MNPRRWPLSALLSCLFLWIGACGPGPDEEAIGDAGLPELDGGADASQPPFEDAGEQDAGLPEPDAGDPSPDAGARPYQDLESLRGPALEAALYDLVKNHISLNYDSGSKVAMVGPDGFDVIDGKVECIYSGALFNPSQLDTEGGFNMEHSWPKSDGAGSRPAESDLHHLFPAERYINGSRGNFPFGDTSCTTDCRAEAGGSKLGPITGGTSLVFQVRPQRQGDIARAHFYFAVRYQMNIPAQEEEALRRWNIADPPDDRERARNLAIEVYQKKRNPFVERPDFVDRIDDF
jgi:hypothetical protein